MATRQTAGMETSLIRLAGLDWAVPDFGTLCRRQKTLAGQIPCGRSDGPLSLLVDSNGIQGRRQWRKVHLAMDTATSDIRAVEVTSSGDGDSPILPELLGQISGDEQIGSGEPRRTQTVPTIRAGAMRPSPNGWLFRSSRTRRTDVPERKGRANAWRIPS